VDYYETLIAQLAEDGAPDTGYAKPGMLFVARDEAELRRLPEALRRMQSRRAEGIGNLGELAMNDIAEAKQRFPPLGSIAGAIFIPGAGRVNGRSLRDALRDAAVRKGAVAVEADARLTRHGDQIAVEANGERSTPEAVVIAGGAWSGALIEAIGFSLPIYPQRGQIAHLDVPDVHTSGWPILEWFGSHYILTFPPNRVVVGATREHDSGFDVRMTAGGVHEVLSVALGIAPGLASATLAEVRVGLRPFSPDGLPVLGRAPGLRNGWLCTGHGPSGLTLGPVSGAIVAALIGDQQPELDLAPFDAARYAAPGYMEGLTAGNASAAVDKVI
jgi:D-amino-acid dehydrogenase